MWDVEKMQLNVWGVFVQGKFYGCYLIFPVSKTTLNWLERTLFESTSKSCHMSRGCFWVLMVWYWTLWITTAEIWIFRHEARRTSRIKRSNACFSNSGLSLNRSGCSKGWDLVDSTLAACDRHLLKAFFSFRAWTSKYLKGYQPNIFLFNGFVKTGFDFCS